MRPDIGEWDSNRFAGEMNIWLHAFKETLRSSEASELGFDLGSLGDSVARNIEQVCDLRPRGLSDVFVLKNLEEAKKLNNEIQTGILAARQAGVGDAAMLNKAEPLCEKLSASLNLNIHSIEATGQGLEGRS
jgi:hypothetical protein